MKWIFYKLGKGSFFDLDFQDKIRDVFIDAFYSGYYPYKKKVWKSLPKRFENSTHLYLLSSDGENTIWGYAFFTVPEKTLMDKIFIWQDGIAVKKALQNKSYAKQVYRQLKEQIYYKDGWLGGRTQNPTIIKSYCKHGISFPFDKTYESKLGEGVLNFLNREITEVKESKKINPASGICKKVYKEGKLGDYENDWTGIEKQKEFLERRGLNQNKGDAVIITIQLP